MLRISLSISFSKCEGATFSFFDILGELDLCNGEDLEEGRGRGRNVVHIIGFHLRNPMTRTFKVPAFCERIIDSKLRKGWVGEIKL